MAESTQLSALPTADHKRRKTEVDAGHVKAERVKGVITDKAKANYLSGQLRLRLQYAKLKVEHGWVCSSFLPVPIHVYGNRKPSLLLKFANGERVHTTLRCSGKCRDEYNFAIEQQLDSLVAESSVVLSLPATPTLTHNRIATPLAPLVGPSKAMTRYPISRTDSCATVVMESIPSLHQTHSAALHPKANSHTASASSTSTSATPASSQPCASNNAFHEPFDPMQPTELVDSQLAALRSIITASTSIPLPPPVPAPSSASPVPPTSNTGTASPGMGGGLTYDAFWSAHGSGTSSYRTLRSGQAVRPAAGVPLQAHASAPAIMAAPAGDGGPSVGPATVR
ncbi:hypothetical protein GSI_13280 [Ganoderma sinense ZZ0214-1]|uniref:Uncharacterized protein n=1 Tax=Ganoderma sinense ZZ0214-1 TaxID=1077348 RepID=A0A2G8RV47_9APHY|nr:hypothetical protein GSI_13280 [Ganoderma sinense ZZ0214-1]